MGKSILAFTVFVCGYAGVANAQLGLEKTRVSSVTEEKCSDLNGYWKVKSCSNSTVPQASLRIVQSGCWEVAVFGVDPQTEKNFALQMLARPPYNTEMTIHWGANSTAKSEVQSAWEGEQKNLHARYKVTVKRAAPEQDHIMQGDATLKLDGKATLKLEMAWNEGGETLNQSCEYTKE